MTIGEQTFRTLQAAARSTGAKNGTAAPTQEYLTRHLLEPSSTGLPAPAMAKTSSSRAGSCSPPTAYVAPTKDADANAIRADVTIDHLITVRDLAAVDTADGVMFDVDTVTVHEIREHADYPGYRVRLTAGIGRWQGIAAWDVSTGDPIVPAPRTVRLDRVLGDPIELLGYARETTIAEKGVTILERGITSTRWRDYIDIVQLARHGIDTADLRRSADAVARYRGVALEPVGPHLADYGRVGQAKWAAWRRKGRLEAVSEDLLDDQVALVAGILDPVFGSAHPR